MTDILVPGMLKPLYWGLESNYGVSPSSALNWACDVVDITPMNDVKQALHHITGSRAYKKSTRGPGDYGFTVKGMARFSATPYFWYNFWARFGLGSTTGTTNRLESFTAQVAVLDSPTTYYNIYNGCKVNKLTLNFPKYGEVVEFEAEVYAQFMESTTSKTLSKLQNVTLGANPTDPATEEITWDTEPAFSIGGLGFSISPRNMKIVVENELTRQYGIRTGVDGKKYPLTRKLSEGRRNITAELSMPLEDMKYVDYKLTNEPVLSLTVWLEEAANYLSLIDGVFMANDFPVLKHDPMDETLKIAFQDIVRA